MLLEIDIVKYITPLLISKGRMSKLGMRIDFTRHEVEVNGQVIKLQCNSDCHYSVSLTNPARENCNAAFHLTSLLSLSNEEKKKKPTKLHGQLCHASKDRLVKLLKDSGCDDKNFLKMIGDCCDDCEF